MHKVFIDWMKVHHPDILAEREKNLIAYGACYLANEAFLAGMKISEKSSCDTESLIL